MLSCSCQSLLESASYQYDYNQNLSHYSDWYLYHSSKKVSIYIKNEIVGDMLKIQAHLLFLFSLDIIVNRVIFLVAMWRML